MFGIILSVVAIVFCALAAFVGIAEKSAGKFFLFAVLTLLNIFILRSNIERYRAKENGEYETKIAKNVIGYTVDSTTVINGADTTKTYTLTYWKNYE